MGYLYQCVAIEPGWNYIWKLHSEKSKRKVWFPNRKIKEGFINPQIAEISNLFWEMLDARFLCQEFRNSVLKHLLKADVALYDIGTGFPGKHQMQTLAR